MPRRNGTGIALLADPTRRAIVALVAAKPRRPSELAGLLGVSRSSVSRQLRLLSDGGLVVCRRWPIDRRSVLVHLDHREVGRIVAWLAGTEVGRAGWAVRPDADGPPTEGTSG